MALGPAQVHPHEHLGEVGCVDAAGPGADRHDGVALVVLTAEQSAHLELPDVLLEACQLALGLVHGVLVGLLRGHLDERLEVLDAAVHGEHPVALGVGAGERGGDLLRLVGVVPQVGGGCLLLQLGDPCAEGVEVGDAAHGVHRRAQFLDLLREVNSHDATAYGRTTMGPYAAGLAPTLTWPSARDRSTAVRGWRRPAAP